MEFSVRVDWLTVSGKISPREGDSQPLGINGYAQFAREIAMDLCETTAPLQTIQPAKHYEYGFQDVHTGLRVYVSEDLQGQGFKAECSGLVCRYIREPRVINSVVEVRKLAVTRFDFAVDVIDGGWHPGEVYDAYIKEHGLDRQKKIVYTNRIDNHGVSFGTHGSERMVRIYDKGREQGVPVDWKRIEAEYHGGYAHHAFEQYTEYPLSLCGDVRSYLRSPDCPAMQALDAISLGAVAERYKRPIAVADKEKWMRGTVRKSFGKMVIEDPDAADRVFADIQETYIAARFAKAIGVSLDEIPTKGIQLQK